MPEEKPEQKPNQKEDCGCKDARWALFLMIVLGLFFGVVAGALGWALFGTIGKWVFAVGGSAFGAVIGWNTQPKSARDIFRIWRN